MKGKVCFIPLAARHCSEGGWWAFPRAELPQAHTGAGAAPGEPRHHFALDTHTTQCPAKLWATQASATIPVSCRALDVLKDFAPGAQLPVLLYNGDPKTDTVNIEDFLEDRLAPPMSVSSTAPDGGSG